MLPDRTPGGNATQKDTGILTPDREANLSRITNAISLVEAEAIRLRGRPDKALRLSDEPGTYWTIQAQRGIISGQDEMPSLTATLHPRKKDGLPPFESIRADLVSHYGTRLGGIHQHPRTGERSWNENADIARLAGLVDTYFAPKPTPTEKTVSWAAGVIRDELRGMQGVRVGKHMIDIDPNSNRSMIRELDKKNGMARLITSDPGSPESADGTPARPARILVQDIKKGEIILDQKRTRRILRSTLRRIFPHHTPRPTVDNFDY